LLPCRANNRLTVVVKYDNLVLGVVDGDAGDAQDAADLMAEGRLRGLGSGVFEIALAFKGDAFRVVYALQLADEVWVVHAFQKKSTQGIQTPKHEIDLIKDRLKRLKEMLG
jgi:phage-related protein